MTAARLLRRGHLLLQLHQRTAQKLFPAIVSVLEVVVVQPASELCSVLEVEVEAEVSCLEPGRRQNCLRSSFRELNDFCSCV
jgi:hypothetical protein